MNSYTWNGDSALGNSGAQETPDIGMGEDVDMGSLRILHSHLHHIHKRHKTHSWLSYIPPIRTHPYRANEVDVFFAPGMAYPDYIAPKGPVGGFAIHPKIQEYVMQTMPTKVKRKIKIRENTVTHQQNCILRFGIQSNLYDGCCLG